MATITKNGKTKNVRNLGWLLRHAADAQHFSFYYRHHGTHDGILVASCRDIEFQTDFASLAVLWKWLNRPVFRGLKFTLCTNKSRDYCIGDEEWNRIQKLRYAFFMHWLVERPIEWETQCHKVKPIRLRKDSHVGCCPTCGNECNCNVRGMNQVDSLGFWQYIRDFHPESALVWLDNNK